MHVVMQGVSSGTLAHCKSWVPFATTRIAKEGTDLFPEFCKPRSLLGICRETRSNAVVNAAVGGPEIPLEDMDTIIAALTAIAGVKREREEDDLSQDDTKRRVTIKTEDE